MARTASGEGELVDRESLAPSPPPSPRRGEGARRVRGCSVSHPSRGAPQGPLAAPQRRFAWAEWVGCGGKAPQIQAGQFGRQERRRQHRGNFFGPAVGREIAL